MKLIVGLGNPGSQYQASRHNTGFMALDTYASKNSLTFRLDTKLEGELALVKNDMEKVIFLRPMTYMNDSGRSLAKVMNFYKIDIDDILVIYDDMDLDVGRLRLRAHGSAGGHNGIKSIISNLGGTDKFKRIKIGIGHNTNNVIDYVLGHFNEADRATLAISFDKVCEIIDLFIKNESFDKIMNHYNIA